MPHPTVIAINSISGGGKTAIANALGEKLSSAQIYHFDDFDETNIYPDDFVAWCKRGADVEEFDFPEMRNTVRKCCMNGEAEHVVLDYPFGRLHPYFCDLITHSIYIDTPFDIAMARRILRDYLSHDRETNQAHGKLKEELTSYLSSIRDVYLHSHQRFREEADFVLDGTLPLDQLANETLIKL